MFYGKKNTGFVFMKMGYYVGLEKKKIGQLLKIMQQAQKMIGPYKNSDWLDHSKWISLSMFFGPVRSKKIED